MNMCVVDKENFNILSTLINFKETDLNASCIIDGHRFQA
jgi:hypothetical protein